MAQSQGPPSLILPPPVLFGLNLAIGGGLQRIMPWFMVPGHLIWPGVAAICFGLALSLWAVVTMHQAGTAVDPRRAATRLVEHGPFAFSRNPIYLSMAVASLGVALWVNSYWLLLSLGLTLVILTYGVIKPEEKYLRDAFGEPYLCYQRRVRRWF